jgi:hypothetical protein
VTTGSTILTGYHEAIIDLIIIAKVADFYRLKRQHVIILFDNAYRIFKIKSVRARILEQ